MSLGTGYVPPRPRADDLSPHASHRAEIVETIPDLFDLLINYYLLLMLVLDPQPLYLYTGFILAFSSGHLDTSLLRGAGFIAPCLLTIDPTHILCHTETYE